MFEKSYWPLKKRLSLLGLSSIDDRYKRGYIIQTYIIVNEIELRNGVRLSWIVKNRDQINNIGERPKLV